MGTLFQVHKYQLNNYFAYWRIGAAADPSQPWADARLQALAAPFTMPDPSALLPQWQRKQDWDRRMYQGQENYPYDQLFMAQDNRRDDFRVPWSSGSGSGSGAGIAGVAAAAAAAAASNATVVRRSASSNATVIRRSAGAGSSGSGRGNAGNNPRRSRSGSGSGNITLPANMPPEARRAVERFGPTLRGLGITVNLEKILGWGGNGVASMYSVRKRGDNRKRRFVLKQSLNQSSLVEEKKMTTSFKRAKHIIQVLGWRDDILQDTGATRSPAMDAILDRSTKSMALEYMPHGDLWDFTLKCALKQVDVPDEVLWMIFSCLVRACIVMYSPPRHIVADNGSESWLPESGDVLDETINRPLPGRGTAYDVVHFDLDSQNIFIGNFDESEHRGVPVLKVGDFGMAKRTSHRLMTADPYTAWAQRRQGKTDWLLPEQFHVEWEYVSRLPSQQNPPPRIAGQYGPHSNVFAIALCMYCLITQSDIPSPPQPVGPLNDPNTQRLFPPDTPNVGMIMNFDGIPVPPFHTYGFNLARDRAFDKVLRNVLLRCLADIPTDRPSLEELLDWVQWKERSWDDAAHARARAFTQSIFNEPPSRVTQVRRGGSSSNNVFFSAQQAP